MSEMNKLNAEALENVVGGATVTVQNDSVGYAYIREAPGLNAPILASVKNGTKLVTLGQKVKKDGYVWYCVMLATGSDDGWIAGSLIGY